jgi:hypothetical protein
MDDGRRHSYASCMSAAAHRFYYLDNFRSALAWLRGRYDDLLAPEEARFVALFERLPQPSAALLVRMITRRGDLFRTDRLAYEEIGCPRAAAAALIEAGLVDPAPQLSWPDWQRLLTKAELATTFTVPSLLQRACKPEVVQYLQATQDAAGALALWCARAGATIYRLSVAALCERLRILFFGNFRQDWSEFVLTDLGIFRYERVYIEEGARAFSRREEIDHFFALYQCREHLRAGAPAEQVLAEMPPPLPGCPWIEARRARLLIRTAQQFEKAGQLAAALAAYDGCDEPHSRVRAIRVLEKLGSWQEAWDQLQRLESDCTSEPARQLSERIRRRLRRRLGHSVEPAKPAAVWPTLRIQMSRPAEPGSLETLAAERLASAEAPVFYVENSLLNSLLGLWGWEAIFAPVPGAFFHPFQAAPADLLAADFTGRRETQLAACRASLDSGAYRDDIRRRFQEKAGLASPFVAWDGLTPELLELALECIPPAHLRRYFNRILADIAANRAGLPDLIQFFPRRRSYRLIEVKGPGDRLQNNQLRWLSFCAAAGIDVAVCKVRWGTA